MQPNRRFVYVALALFAASVPVGTWVVDKGFMVIHVSQLLVLFLAVAGFALYGYGRDDFSTQTKINRVVSTYLFFFGAFLFFYGLYINLFAYDAVRFHVYEPLLLHSWPFNENAVWSSIFDLIWSSLWIIAGLLFAVDGLSLPPKSIKAAMLAAVSFLVFWNMRAYSWLFLGYPLYLAISLGALLLTTVGLARFAVFVRRRSEHG